MAYSGGLRLRLIKDSFHYMVDKGLQDLGVYDATIFKTKVKLLNEQLDSSKAIPLNTIGISTEDIDTNPAELGSNMDRYGWEVYVDIFAESEAAGVHLMGDVMGIIQGKFASIGRTSPVLPVYDFTQPSKPEIFYCEIENVDSGRVAEGDKSFNKYWWVVGCTIEDNHSGE